ncbi:hypothetical protein EJ03DRAFT_330193 [Teratosphaeria nubilosa]|uniref:Phosphatases II n=1 Tax=Teratosphaeria nubilosa TaxID=161662 RepID=A0A6G1L267_9PEZI|nr:hypothetical protein EJ03DRAFT_330193 [Teratosphaeria nubilosa]
MASGNTTDLLHHPSLPAFLQQSRAQLHAKFVDLEWQQRNRLLQGTQAAHQPFARLGGEAIAARNRYLNVEPYADNRIKLKVAKGVNDYINASPIALGKRRYIATQGPKNTSVNHFYRMLADDHVVQSPVVVVMLTQTHEAGREKCFQYYPLAKEESPLVIEEDAEINDGFHGEVELDSVEQDASTRSEIRHLRLRTHMSREADTPASEVKEKEIHHLLFSGWPDFLVPEGHDRRGLLSLIHLSASLNHPSSTHPPINGHRPAHSSLTTPQSNPRIIHCSAGVGRSGTFIALDYLLSLLQTGDLDNIPTDRDPVAETVDLLRQQRMMMVQGEGQFYFVYEVLREQFLVQRLGVAPEALGLGGTGDTGAGASVED